MPLHVGVTASRHGLHIPAAHVGVGLLKGLKATTDGPWFLHHGDCVGGDEGLHALARTLGYHIIVHPPLSDALRAFCDYDEIRPEKDYLDRNQDIVDESDHVLGFPWEPTPQKQGGTWSTIRYALRQKKNLTIIMPDGKYRMKLSSNVKEDSGGLLGMPGSDGLRGPQV